MDNELVISLKNVTKAFRLCPGGGRTLKAKVLDIFRAGRGSSVYKALNDVSFSVKKGETLGIIGANGAGKSTLLSVVARTMVPTSGEVVTKGSISSLLELGAGFHPDLTGRENVFLYGAIMGLSRKEMRERFDAIVAFAGIEDYIDQPVRHYSSGMYVRLGFAVAVEVNPDILLIDEVLAVGDTNFQSKCIGKMHEFRERGKTMLIVSHDLTTIQSISDRILLLDEGRVLGMGGPESVISTYRSLSAKKSTGGLEREWGTGEVRINDVEFFDKDGKAGTVFQWGSGLRARIHYDAAERVDKPVFGFALSDANGRLIYGNNTQVEKVDISHVQGKGIIDLELDPLNMSAGSYLFSFSIHSWDHRTNYHRLDNCFPIILESKKAFEGACYMPSKWKMG